MKTINFLWWHTIITSVDQCIKDIHNKNTVFQFVLNHNVPEKILHWKPLLQFCCVVPYT